MHYYQNDAPVLAGSRSSRLKYHSYLFSVYEPSKSWATSLFPPFIVNSHKTVHVSSSSPKSILSLIRLNAHIELSCTTTAWLLYKNVLKRKASCRVNKNLLTGSLQLFLSILSYAFQQLHLYRKRGYHPAIPSVVSLWSLLCRRAPSTAYYALLHPFHMTEPSQYT